MKYNTAGRAMYMHNKALIEVLGHELTHRLYGSMQPLAQDGEGLRARAARAHVQR